METETMERPKIHHGRNIKRLRDILGVKQEKIAFELNLTQQAVSKLEQKEKIDDETLEKIAKVLKVPVEAIKNFDDDATISFVANTFNDSTAGYISNSNYNCNFNPLDKVVELYERMLEMERERNK